MNESDRQEFANVLRASMEVYDKKPSADALRVWWAALSEVSLSEVRHALTQHISQSPYAPKPADILDYCQQDDGRPGAEEAWAMIPKDEDDSVVWTEEMAAAFGAASPLLNDGDTIGARMAFKERYEKEVEAARREGKPVNWMPSFGVDKLGREAALTDAVQKKRLPAEKAIKYMPESKQLAHIAEQPLLEHSPQGQQRIKQLIHSLQEEGETESLPDSELLEKASEAFAEINQKELYGEKA